MSSSAQLQVRQKAGIAEWVFALSVLAALILFFVPAFIIRPFHYQSPRALSLALAIKQAAPSPTLILAVASAALALPLWRRVSRGGRILVMSGVVLAAAAAVMVRINYFEWMFHPVPQAGFESIDHAKLADSEMVMTVRFGADARAYPIRAMAYHHVLNNVVAGVPIAITY